MPLPVDAALNTRYVLREFDAPNGDAEHYRSLHNLDYYDSVQPSLVGWLRNDFVPHSPFADAPFDGDCERDNGEEVRAQKIVRRDSGLERLRVAIARGEKVGFSGGYRAS